MGKWGVGIGAFTVGAIVGAAAVFAWGVWRYWIDTRLGRELKTKGWVVITRPGCGACMLQKAELGSSFNYVARVSCEIPSSADSLKTIPDNDLTLDNICSSKDAVFPTWLRMEYDSKLGAEKIVETRKGFIPAQVLKTWI